MFVLYNSSKLFSQLQTIAKCCVLFQSNIKVSNLPLLLQSILMNSLNLKKSSETRRYRKVGPYFLMNVIGKGSYSTVYEARKQGEKKRYAVKQISLVTVKPKQLERIRLQIKVLTQIKHQNIVCLLDFKQTSRNLYLVFEYCKHTDLDAYTEKYCLGKLPEQKVKKIAIQLKNALQVLRAHKVVHRDLKLANILVTEDFEIKIADFGFAKHLDDDQFLKSYVGTPLTMAPEILEKKSYNEKCDLWSLGIIFYQLLFGKNPFVTKQNMFIKDLIQAIKGELKIPKQISEQAEDILRKLIVKEPSQRISFQDFFKHPWLSEGNGVTGINQDLLQQALRAELNKALLVSNKKKQQKQFLLQKAEDLLSYQIIQNVKNSIQSKIMLWINLSKRLMSMEHRNSKLCFLSIAVLMQNLEECQARNFTVHVNEQRKIGLLRYENIRKLQKWEMSQYTKRLPGFIERSELKMIDYLKKLKHQFKEFDSKQMDTKIQHLFLLELTQQIVTQIENKQAHEAISVFMKIKPFNSSDLYLKITSNQVSQNTLNMLLKKITLHIQNNKMYKKCAGIFKLETVHKDYPQDRIFENIKQLLQ